MVDPKREKPNEDEVGEAVEEGLGSGLAIGGTVFLFKEKDQDPNEEDAQ